MAQAFGGNIAHAAERIGQRAVVGLGDGVDGEIAPGEIVLQRHLRRRIKGKSRVARPGLALSASERILLMGFRVQEDRKIPPDRLEARRPHGLGRGADDDVIAILHRQSEQGIAHRAADQVDFHRRP